MKNSGTLLSKLSLCAFYYRLSPARWYQYSIIFTSFLCIACFGSVFFAVLFACRPVSAAWNLRLYTGDNCIARPPWYILQAITGGVTDLLLMVNPIPTVLGLQMSTKHKAALIAWFGIGTITLATAVMRAISLLSMISSSDTPWTMADAMLWLVVESNLIVLCGCLPTFRVWITHVFSRRRLPSKGNSGGGSQGQAAQGTPLRTFGQGKTRHFDTVAEIERDNIKADDDYNGTEPPTSRHGVAVSDTGSEERILHTQTRVISSSE
ncbi:hypothetical protein PFICI_05372 [Pestalotiopsis fici W106-1]|uniref:Rhodopsin domain-containing protein n=1 Tax=Pestalotiopsis fici (strain W106-1 / CGMCC3.15140) TaxID=1229662 RepID=W3XE64_PESFW|nr:uncharacterized protein PFICI_05372 [Pestalotiopsis fici W106-1]ETS83496.1 hypothetical protein PFICI_05372 [Pestalotiopsis fici W106-1]